MNDNGDCEMRFAVAAVVVIGRSLDLHVSNGSLQRLYQRGKDLRVIHGDVSQNLAVYADVLQLQTVHQA